MTNRTKRALGTNADEIAALKREIARLDAHINRSNRTSWPLIILASLLLLHGLAYIFVPELEALVTWLDSLRGVS